MANGISMIGRVSEHGGGKPAVALERCVGPFERHCAAAPMRPDSAYVAAPLLAFGAAPRLASASLSRTVAFDRAEAAGANVTQTNMVRVSSFNGPNGLLLGHDVLPSDLGPSCLVPDRDEAYDAEPLFTASRALFGTVGERRFPLMPGQHLLCAYKEAFVEGPGLMYAAFAIGLPEDRGRDADLFMEDVGALDPDEDAAGQRQALARALLDSVALVGENLRAQYSRVFVGVRVRHVPEGSVGCALAAAPYVQLARAAMPEEGVEALGRLSPQEWERRVSARFLDPIPSAELATVEAGGR